MLECRRSLKKDMLCLKGKGQRAQEVKEVKREQNKQKGLYERGTRREESTEMKKYFVTKKTCIFFYSRK